MASKEKEASSSLVELDPLLKDLTEKKQSFRKNVVSLAAELKYSSSSREQYLKELDDLRSQLSFTEATAEASAASAESAQSQCLSLLRELDKKNTSLEENEIICKKISKQESFLKKQLKDEVLRMEKEIMQLVTQAGANTDCELRKMLDEVSPRNFHKMNRLLDEKDDEIVRLRDEIRFLSAHWKHKTKELESQLEKHHRTDQELKKKVLKLEFCLQEARCQMRKLQRGGERGDRALKELRDQVAMKEQHEDGIHSKPNFWESPGFKAIVSMSMLILVAFSRR